MKKVRNWKQLCNHPAVDHAYEEDDFGVSYWVHLKEGYTNSESECRTIHEGTKGECIEVFNNNTQINK